MALVKAQKDNVILVAPVYMYMYMFVTSEMMNTCTLKGWQFYFDKKKIKNKKIPDHLQWLLEQR